MRSKCRKVNRLRVAMRSPLPFPCVPDRPSKILLVQVGTLCLSSSHPSFCLPVFFLSDARAPEGEYLSATARTLSLLLSLFLLANSNPSDSRRWGTRVRVPRVPVGSITYQVQDIRIRHTHI